MRINDGVLKQRGQKCWMCGDSTPHITKEMCRIMGLRYYVGSNLCAGTKVPHPSGEFGPIKAHMMDSVAIDIKSTLGFSILMCVNEREKLW